MKILHIIPFYKPAYVYGGPIYSGSALCENLVANGHSVTVLTTVANGDTDLDVPAGEPQYIEGVEVYYFKRQTYNNTFLSLPLIKYLRRNYKNYDVVHVHTYWNMVSLLSLLILVWGKVRPVLSPRGMLSEYIIKNNHGFQKKIIQALAGNFVSNRSKFHVTADSERLEIEALYPDVLIDTIFNFVKLPGIKIETKPDPDERLNLIFLSRIDPKKGIELLLKALAQVKWNYMLSIAGPADEAYLNSLKQLSADLGISDKVTWLGPVYGDEKFRLLSSQHVMMLTSYNENFANVVVEALGMGTPVFISNMVGLCNYVEDNKMGWICGLGLDDIVTKLGEMYRERSRIAEIREFAPAKIIQDFSSVQLLQKYLDLYAK